MRPSHFRHRLRYLLDASGLTRKELSLLCDLRHSYFGSIFRPKRPEMGSSRLTALAIVLGISIDWLLKNEGARPTKTAIQAAVERAQGDRDAVRRKVEEVLGPTDAEGESTAPPKPRRPRPKRSSPPPRPIAKTRPSKAPPITEARPS